MTQLSVVITTFNDSDFLPEAIQSIINQNQLPAEIIVVNDGSSLYHEEKIKKIVTEFNKNTKIPIILLNKKNGGPSSARNLGIKNSKYEYIAFLDADDYWSRTRLSVLLPKIDKTDSNCAAIYTGATLSNKKGKEKFIYNQIIDKSKSHLVGTTNGVACGSPFFIFRKKCLLLINGFDEQIKWNEDLDLILQILGNGYILLGVEDYSFIRRNRKNSYSKIKTRQTYNNIYKFLDKNMNLKNISVEETKKRKKYTSMLYLKQAIIKLSIADINFYSEQAFRFTPAEGFKQNLLYISSSLILKIFKNKNNI